MRTKVFSAISLFGAVLFLGSCEKINPDDNASTIKVPYALFASEQEGSIWKTNDATNFDLWSGGGSAFSNEFFLADTNFIQIRQKLYVWNGTKSPKFPKINSSFQPFTDSKAEAPGQLNIGWHDKTNKLVWVCSTPKLHYTNDNGATWQPYSSPPPVVAMGSSNSVTQLNNARLFLLDISYKIFQNSNGLPNNAFVSCAGAGIPVNVNAEWALAKHNDRLWLMDETGINQAYYSDDFAATFKKSNGLPLNKEVRCAKQVGGDFYVGTDSGGLYKLDPSGINFVRTGLGLPGNARIWDIVAKRNVYTTDQTKDYLFLATDKGLYQSDNNGADWKLIKEGQFVNLL